MPSCPECGTDVRDDEQFCPNCGTGLSGEQGGDQWGQDTTQSGGQQQGGGQGWGDDYNQQQTGNQGYQQQTGNQRQQAGNQGYNQQQTGNQRQQAGNQGYQQQARGGQARAAGGGTVPQRSSGALDFTIGYPKRDGWTPVLISVLLTLGSFLILPLLPLLGYTYRVGRNAALGRPNPPQYGDWGGLFVDGLRYVALALAVGIGVVVGVFGLALVLGSISDVLGAFAFFAGYLGAFYVGAAILTAFIGGNSVIGAFTDGRAVQLLKSPYFMKATLIYIGIALVFNIVILVSIITIIGPLILNAYFILSFGAYLGYVYFQAAEKGIVAPPADSQRQAPQSGGARAQPRQ
jgi:hypothetical protein